MELGLESSVAISAGRKNRARLRVTFVLTAGYTLAEAIGGVLTGSLELLADAGHMLTDAGALGLALVAIRYAERPANPRKTYCFSRAEILAAFVNAVALLLISISILFEAWRRFRQPPESLGGPMRAVALIGLNVNFTSMRVLTSAAGESLNVKGAHIAVLDGMLGCLGVILAGVIVMAAGRYLADPIIGAAIGLFIVPRTWSLLGDATHILMEGVPERIHIAVLESARSEKFRVLDIHDLHVWTLTPGWDPLNAHVFTEDVSQQPRILTDLQKRLKKRFEIEHSKLQLEEKGRERESWPL